VAKSFQMVPVLVPQVNKNLTEPVFALFLVKLLLEDNVNAHLDNKLVVHLAYQFVLLHKF
jgi:hypothetical protein